MSRCHDCERSTSGRCGLHQQEGVVVGNSATTSGPCECAALTAARAEVQRLRRKLYLLGHDEESEQ